MPEGEEQRDGEDAITFSSLREIQRKERDFTPLSSLPQGFYLKVAMYFSLSNRTIEGLLEKKRENEFAAKILRQKETEVENARGVVKDIFSRRLRKILVLAHEAVFTRAIADTKAMTAEELEIFESLSKRLSDFDEKVYIRILESAVSKVREGFVRVEFLDECPAFVGSDLKNYGPYSIGERSEIPGKNAEILVSSGKAKKA